MKNSSESVAIQAEIDSVEKELIIPESVKKFERMLAPSVINDRPVLVRLSKTIDIYIVTSKSGSHLNLFAEKLLLKPINSHIEYVNWDIGFSSLDDKKLRITAEKLDRDPKDNVISMDEFCNTYYWR